ncbi:NAD(P)-dependent oxidoreductase [Glycomyces tenuis]|uniref:NAD(P)-dependent oxidoreductase n=1 Tax=Glycomyces tenuis TaxID=58116 RepID=UPI000408460A|nr:NAD(P)-binding domain-containing protein [Glycomyces tenuis]
MSQGTISILGLGNMGSVMTERLRAAGYTTTVWNRTAAKTEPHVKAGSTAAATVAAAVAASDLILVVLLDHASVREHLDPVAAELEGKVVVNLTTTTPNEARDTAAWAADHGIVYLDGAIMATPDMIGEAGSLLFYSGSENAYAIARPALETFGTAQFVGTDAGVASLKDMALLSAMDLMFSGFVQAIAMMRTAGATAVDTAVEVEAWLAAMLPHGKALAAIIDGGTYDTGGQNVDFALTGSTSMITASREQGIRADLLESHHKFLKELSATGHGNSDWLRVIELLTIR